MYLLFVLRMEAEKSSDLNYSVPNKNLDSTFAWSLQHSMTPNDDMKHAFCNAHFLF